MYRIFQSKGKGTNKGKGKGRVKGKDKLHPITGHEDP